MPVGIEIAMAHEDVRKNSSGQFNNDMCRTGYQAGRVAMKLAALLMVSAVNTIHLLCSVVLLGFSATESTIAGNCSLL